MEEPRAGLDLAFKEVVQRGLGWFMMPTRNHSSHIISSIYVCRYISRGIQYILYIPIK